MDIQSIINISKFIEIDEINEFGDEMSRQIGYLSASVNKGNQQCVINIQLFEKEKFDELKEEIRKQTEEFFTHLSACVCDSNLSVLRSVLPNDKEVEQKVAKMSL